VLFPASNVEPTTVASFLQRRNEKQGRSQLKTIANAVAAPSVNSLQVLESRLLNATIGQGVVPAAHAISEKFPTQNCSPVSISELPDKATDAENPEIVYAFEMVVDDLPNPVAFLPHQLFASVKCSGYEEEKDRFIRSIRYDSRQLAQITKITEGQNKNIEWYRQRMGSLTASNFGQVLRCAQRDTHTASLIRSIQGYAFRNCSRIPQATAKSLQWGISHECDARRLYEFLSEKTTVAFVCLWQDCLFAKTITLCEAAQMESFRVHVIRKTG
jgi:hypothetical protein